MKRHTWFGDRPIILPSICFLIFPFLIIFTVNTLNFPLEKSANNSSLFTWLTTIFTVAITALGVFINNRYSEHRKNKKEQKELANIFIPIINGHLLRIKKLKNIQFSTAPSENDIKEIDRYTNRIKNDHIYQSFLSKIGILEPKITSLIIEYYQSISFFIDELNENLDRDNQHLSRYFAWKCKDIIHINIVKSYLLMMILSKLITNDRQKYQETKKLIIEEYFNICKTDKTLLVSNDFVVQTNGGHPTTFEKKELLELVIFIFKELGILSELKRI